MPIHIVVTKSELSIRLWLLTFWTKMPHWFLISKQILYCQFLAWWQKPGPVLLIWAWSFLGFSDVPKGCSCDHKWQVKEGWIRAVALLRLWGCNNGVSNDSLLAWQWGVSEGSEGVEQYVNYSNYGNLIGDRNNRYEGSEVRILLSQRGKEKALGELGCMKRSGRCDERSAKHRVSRLERMKLIKVVRKVFKTWSREGKLLLAFHMVSTTIKYKTLCHVWATQRFRREPQDMVICK